MTEGIKIEVPEAPVADATLHVPLSGGRVAQIRPGKTGDWIKASQAAGENASVAETVLALAARLTLIDGKPILFEQLKELPLADGLAIQRALFKAVFPQEAPSS